MTIYVVLRESECFSDALHVVGVATTKEIAEHIASVTGDQYDPCRIEEYETDTITPDSLLEYQVINDRRGLFATYVGDESEDAHNVPGLDAEIVYAHNHAEAVDIVKKRRRPL